MRGGGGVGEGWGLWEGWGCVKHKRLVRHWVGPQGKGWGMGKWRGGVEGEGSGMGKWRWLRSGQGWGGKREDAAPLLLGSDMYIYIYIYSKQTVRFGSVTVSVSAVRFGGSGLSDGSGRFGSRFARFHKKTSHPEPP